MRPARVADAAHGRLLFNCVGIDPIDCVYGIGNVIEKNWPGSVTRGHKQLWFCLGSFVGSFVAS